MVAFSTYVAIAYDVAQSRDWYGREMRGPGTQPAHNRFMSELADVYDSQGHAEASESTARSFLEENVGPP
jgi:hypothetical protein